MFNAGIERRLHPFLLSVAFVGAFAAGLLAAPGVLGQSRSRGAAASTVSVSFGKPAEWSFALSTTWVPPGTVTFSLRNRGRRQHTFGLCSSSGASTRCKVVATKLVAPGTTATVTVTLARNVYAYLSPGSKAATPPKSRFLLVVSPDPPLKVSVVPPANLPPTTSTTQLTETIGPSGPCASPQATTVTVTDFDFGFTLSPTTAPCGTITFIQTNTGQVDHNFDINGSAGHNQGLLGPGQSSTTVATFKPGLYQYYCDFSGHIVLGMIGTFRVTAS